MGQKGGCRLPPERGQHPCPQGQVTPPLLPPRAPESIQPDAPPLPKCRGAPAPVSRAALASPRKPEGGALTKGNGWHSSRSSCSRTFFLTLPGNCTSPQNLPARAAVSTRCEHADAQGRVGPRPRPLQTKARRPLGQLLWTLPFPAGQACDGVTDPSQQTSENDFTRPQGHTSALPATLSSDLGLTRRRWSAASGRPWTS